MVFVSIFNGLLPVNKVHLGNESEGSLPRCISSSRLKAFFQYLCDIFAFSHCVEVYRRDSVTNQIFALHCAPVGP